MSQRAIQKVLETEFRDPVSKGTVGNWTKGFKYANPTGIDPEAPFVWSRMDQAGIPWDAGSFLLRFAQYEKRNPSIPIQPEKSNPRRLTFREARWAWRIWEATERKVRDEPTELQRDLATDESGYMSWDELELTALALAQAEEAREILGLNFNTDQIEDYLGRRLINDPDARVRTGAHSVPAWGLDIDFWRLLTETRTTLGQLTADQKRVRSESEANL